MLSLDPVIKYVHKIGDKHLHVLSMCSINKHRRKLILFISSLFNLCEDCDIIRSVMLNQCTCICYQYTYNVISISFFFWFWVNIQ